MRSMFLAAIALIGIGASTVGGAEETPQRLDLVCLGAGAANRANNSTVSAWGSDGSYGSANIVGNRSVPFDDQVNLWIEGSEGRIRMPRAMLPLFRGGDDGWFKIKSIEIGADEITGSVAVNVINNPSCA